MIHGLYDPLTTSSLLTLSEFGTRTNNYKLSKPRVESNQYQKFFTNRIINVWNGLPGVVVGASSMNIFKNYVDAHFENFIYCTNFTL